MDSYFVFTVILRSNMAYDFHYLWTDSYQTWDLVIPEVAEDEMFSEIRSKMAVISIQSCNGYFESIALFMFRIISIL